MTTVSTAPAALQLRVSGAPWTEIAEILSLSDAGAARRLVEQALAADAGEMEPQTREEMRAEQAARLMSLLSGVWEKATNETDPEHLPAAKVALQIIDRHSRLLGLDQPTEVVVYNPTQTEIDQWLATVLTQNTPELDEGDVVDLGDEAISES